MEIRIEGTDLPGSSCGPGPDAPDGHHGIHVAVQRRGRPDDLLDLVSGAAASATWTLPCEVISSPAGLDFRGPYIQGRPAGRFIYLSWGRVDSAGSFTMFRRAKLMLDAIPDGVVHESVESGLLVGRLGLTDAKGNPRCAAVRPPVIEWFAAAAG